MMTAKPEVQGSDSQGDAHFIPAGEEGRHEFSYLCGCNPDWHGAQDVGDESGWVHFRFDGPKAEEA